MTHEMMMKRVMSTLSRAKFTEYSLDLPYTNGTTVTVQGLKYRHLFIDKRDEGGNPYVITHVPTLRIVARYGSMEQARIAAIRFADLVTSVMTHEDTQSPNFKHITACRMLKSYADADISRFYDPEEQEQAVVVSTPLPQRRQPPAPLPRRRPPPAVL